MARLPRLWLPGVAQHLIVRGNNRQAIFRSDGDRIFFHRCLVQTSRRFGVQVHAYVLMTNHVHLLASAAEAGAVSSVIQAMGRRYVSYFNYLHERTGTLWEGRFRACLVETERYFLACQRYIELNPVRSAITADADGFEWSSHRHYAWGKADDLVTPHPVYLGLAPDEALRRATYRAFVGCGTSGDEVARIRTSLNKGWPLGGDPFRAWLEEVSGRRLGPQARGRPKGRPRKNGELAKSDSDPIYQGGQGTARSWEPG